MAVSDQQRLFAQDIALLLNLQEPDIDDVPKFIEEYSEKYQFERKVQKLKRMIEMPGSNYGFFREYYGIGAIAFLEDCLQEKSGIYAFVDNTCDYVVYIGKSKDLAQRIPQSFGERFRERSKNKVRDIIVKYYLTSEANMSVLEMYLIGKYKPLFNVDGNNRGSLTVFKSEIDVIRDFKYLPKSIEEAKIQKEVVRNEQRMG